MKTTTKTVLLCGLLSASSQLDAAQPLFATGINSYTQSNSVLYRIDDYSIAPKAVRIGDTGRQFIDIAIDPTNQRFYAVSRGNPASALYELNPTNGSATLIQTISALMPGLTFDRSGQLWGWGGSGTNSGLYKINKQTGLATLVGISGVSGAVGDLAFDTNGTLFATTLGNNLVRLDTNNGAATLVGALINVSGQTVSNLYGLEIDTDGIMYAGRGIFDGTTYTGRAELYVVNKPNGAVTLIGAIDCADGFSLAGLSFLGATIPPVQPTSSIYMAVEVSWNSEANRLYQVQWSSNPDSGNWVDLGLRTLGNGSTNSILNSTRGSEKRFYRVQALQ